jgi:hypothetical protein
VVSIPTSGSIGIPDINRVVEASTPKVPSICLTSSTVSSIVKDFGSSVANMPNQ